MYPQTIFVVVVCNRKNPIFLQNSWLTAHVLLNELVWPATTAEAEQLLLAALSRVSAHDSAADPPLPLVRECVQALLSHVSLVCQQSYFF